MCYLVSISQVCQLVKQKLQIAKILTLYYCPSMLLQSIMMLMLRRLEDSLETTVELLGEDAVTFVLMTPILWSLQWIR